MIRLVLAPEPEGFRTKVREPGENAVACLAGLPLPHKRAGRPISATRKVGGQELRKTLEDFPYWQDCIDDLYSAYKGICAYYCHRIEKTTGPTVDHYVAKSSSAAAEAYAWSNYRLASSGANACKGTSTRVLDPTQIEDGWFRLDLDTLKVSPNPALPAPLRQAIDDTIADLKLDGPDAREVKAHALMHFRRNGDLEFLLHDHPFLAAELVRQGVTHPSKLAPASVVERPEPEL